MRHNGLTTSAVAVNLSPLQFRVGNLLSVVMDTLKQTGLPPTRLELEITETLLLEKSSQVLATLHAVCVRSASAISMDDFGTGYSSLSYLRSFPFDKIKIDQSFVRDLGANRDAQAIVSLDHQPRQGASGSRSRPKASRPKPN